MYFIRWKLYTIIVLNGEVCRQKVIYLKDRERPNNTGRRITFLQPILASLILVYMIDKMLQITKMRVNCRTRGGCFHSNITQYLTTDVTPTREQSWVIGSPFILLYKGLYDVAVTKFLFCVPGDWHFHSLYQIINHIYLNQLC